MSTRFTSPIVSVCALVFTLGAACSSTPPSPTTGDVTDAATPLDAAVPGPKPVLLGDDPVEQSGPFPVGHTSFLLVDSVRVRSLRVHVWYPADASAKAAADAGQPLADLIAAGKDHDAFAALAAKAPPSCTTQRTHAAADAPIAAAPAKLPLAIFSHCHTCLGISALSIAERLASHGIAVIAPDHAGNTLFDQLAGTSAQVGPEFLEVRVGDVKVVLDAVLNSTDPSSTVLPAQLRGRFDPARVAIFGHSFGGVTTGLALIRDPRFVAGLSIAAPFESFGPAKMAAIHVPTLILEALEDNSIGRIGNAVVDDNFTHAVAASWLVQVQDAGHWSFSDLCGLVANFAPGCGVGDRQSDPGTAFTYLDSPSARSLGAAYVTAFMRAELLADAAARAFLSAPHPADLVMIQARK